MQAAVSNRASVPWIVLTLHKPFYCSAKGSPSFASQLEDLLLKYDVDLTIAGHMHLYEARFLQLFHWPSLHVIPFTEDSPRCEGRRHSISREGT